MLRCLYKSVDSSYMYSKLKCKLYRPIYMEILNIKLFWFEFWFMWWQIAEEFAKILLHLSDRYSTKDFVTLRFKSLVALAVHAPEQVINQWYLQISGLFIFTDIIIDYSRNIILRHVDISNYQTLYMHISSVEFICKHYFEIWRYLQIQISSMILL